MVEFSHHFDLFVLDSIQFQIKHGQNDATHFVSCNLMDTQTVVTSSNNLGHIHYNT
jgi:hypothetical protein